MPSADLNTSANRGESVLRLRHTGARGEKHHLKTPAEVRQEVVRNKRELYEQNRAKQLFFAEQARNKRRAREQLRATVSTKLTQRAKNGYGESHYDPDAETSAIADSLKALGGRPYRSASVASNSDAAGGGRLRHASGSRAGHYGLVSHAAPSTTGLTSPRSPRESDTHGTKAVTPADLFRVLDAPPFLRTLHKLAFQAAAPTTSEMSTEISSLQKQRQKNKQQAAPGEHQPAAMSAELRGKLEAERVMFHGQIGVQGGGERQPRAPQSPTGVSRSPHPHSVVRSPGGVHTPSREEAATRRPRVRAAAYSGVAELLPEVAQADEERHLREAKSMLRRSEKGSHY